jgi:ergothioneine biosynthesis protein EgtB
MGPGTTRHAGRELLSLALIDARNHSLRWATAFEAADRARASAEGLASAAWELGQLGWSQEHWIARNVQRHRGEHADASQAKLASVLPGADDWFARPAAEGPPLPDLQTIRAYLVDTLETTLDLLQHAAETDDALYFFRWALWHEDACAERLAVLAQTLGVPDGPQPATAAVPARAALLVPAGRLRLGSEPGGFVPLAERWAHDRPFDEFEIDAQAVTWGQYAEFVQDAGYDDRRHWTPAGWEWVQAQGRRTPRHVEQMRGGVLLRRYGRPVRAAHGQSAVHVSWHEADAWCRWAGRRLPGEAEWEAAALEGAARGLRWGDVREWTAGTLRPYPGAPAAAPAQRFDDGGGIGPAWRVLRGASAATRPRRRDPKARFAAAPGDDRGFHGFRSCAF